MCGAALVLLAALAGTAGRAEEPKPASSTAQAQPAPGPADATKAEAPPPDPEQDEAWKLPERGLLFHPAGPGQGKDRMALGGLWQIAPMFTANYRRGLGSGFSWDGRLQTIIVFNQLTVGAAWAAEVGPFHLGVMAHVGGFFGALGKALIATTEFNSTGWGILVNPGVLAGMQVAKNAWLTLQIEGYFAPYQAAKLGDLVVTADSAAWEGGGASLIVEHAPAMKGVIYYGVSLYHTRSNYPFWFNVETSPSSAPFSAAKIWYLGLLAGYEF
jgi:hypothetical protein